MIKEEKKGKDIILKVDEESQVSKDEEFSADDVSSDVNQVEHHVTDELKEEEEEAQHPTTPWIQEVLFGMKDFVYNLLYPSSTLGVDYYSIMFFTEFITFVFLLLFQRDFTGVESQDVVGVRFMSSFIFM